MTTIYWANEYDPHPVLKPFVNTDIVGIRSNNGILKVESDDKPPVFRDDANEIIDSWPAGGDIWINYEPMMKNADGSPSAHRFLSYWDHPTEAVEIRTALAEKIWQRRPDVTVWLYTIPGLVNSVTKDIDKAIRHAEREVAFSSATRWNIKPAISGYIDTRRADYLNEWRRRMDWAVGLSHGIHGEPPLVFVWEGGWQGGASYSDMRAILKYCKKRDLSVAYWTNYPPTNHAQAALFEYAAL
jgi:hypothetical protein